MNYEFGVLLNNGYCEGTIDIEAKGYDEAYQKAMDEIGNALKNFPLTVYYNVECISEPDYVEEIINTFNNVMNTTEYSKDDVDVVINEETGMYYLTYHSRHNSFPVSEDICCVDNVDKNELVSRLDDEGIGYCL